MKKITRNLLLTGLCFYTFGQTVNAQEQMEEHVEDEDKVELVLSLNHDSFFGLNPAMEGDYSFDNKNALSFYAIMWGAGTGSAWGNWTEFGLGYKYRGNNFSIKPQIGVTFGSLLSSGGEGDGIVADGIVPNIFIDYDDQKIVGQIYTGFYTPWRKTTVNGQSTNQYLHYWGYLGYRPASWFTFGAHYEHLLLTGGQENGGGELAVAPGYNWIGPYVQFSKGHASLRFSAGPNIADKQDRFAKNEFYKTSFTIGL